MTDRIYALSVALAEDVRTEDVENIIRAIKMIKGVLDVDLHVTDISQWTAQRRAKAELSAALWEFLYPESYKE